MLRNVKISMITAGVLVLAPNFGQAASENQLQPLQDNFYLQVIGGPAFTSSLTETDATTNNKLTIDYNIGATFGLALGMKYSHMRFEIESLGIVSGMKNMKSGGVTINDPDAHTASSALMVNAYYHPTDPVERFQPYLGLGAGYAAVEHDLNDVSGDAGVLERQHTAGFQGIAGLGYRTGEHWLLGVDYRYFITPEYHFNDEYDHRYEERYQNHSINLGISYYFM